MSKFLIVTSALLLCTATTDAQLPSTDAYLLTVFNNGKKVTTRDITYLSGMNPNGYNNQPFFSGPHELYLTSNLHDKQYTDIMKLDLLSNEYSYFTLTDSISEYSPTPTAGNNMLSCVRVEKDHKTQALHLYPLSQENGGRRLAKDINNVGYHQWMSESEVALFLVTQPTSLVLYDIENQTKKLISENVGKGMKQDKYGNLMYIHKVRDDLWYIKSYDPESETSEIVTQTIPGSEFFELMVDGTILMGGGSSIYYFMPGVSDTWQEATDLYQYGIENITRMAVSRNKLVIINKKINE